MQHEWIFNLEKYWLSGTVGWLCATEDLKNDTRNVSSLMLSVNGWVQGNGSHVVMPLTCHQCRIQTTCDTLNGVQKVNT